MTERQTELARRAVAAKGWRWLPGMLESKGLRILRVAPDGYAFAWNQKYHHGWTIGSEALPDLGDAATRGCVLELVRMAWESKRGADGIASTVHTMSGWGVGSRVGSECLAAIVLPTYATEADALIAALEAAP
jgi:hypothetical protein